MKDNFLTKSFFTIGKNLDSCLGCEYCRLLNNETRGFDINTVPSEINKNFSKFPVAVNLFYGDPMLQYENTLRILEKLEKFSHKGPIVIITKAKVKDLDKVKRFDLDIHICLSTFGVDHPIDRGSRNVFEYNLENLANTGLKTSIEFRPIIFGINDSEESLKYVFEKAKKYRAPIGYCGLQGKPEVLENLRRKNFNVIQYPGHVFHTHKKIIGKNIEEKIVSFSKDYNVPAFKKTSCLISFQHGLERDYNAHYYRPGEVGCNGCSMQQKCFDFKASIDKSIFEKTKKVLPFDHEIVYKEKHTCILAKQNICESVTEHCFNIKGYLIKTGQVLTTSDVRATKWLTGMTMEVTMEEKPYLSSFWEEK